MPIVHTPYLPQWSEGAQRFVNDCGPACIAMLLSLYGKLGPLTIDQLAAETGLRTSDVGLLPNALVTLGYTHGLKLRTMYAVIPDEIRLEIEGGRPVIALVAYRYIIGRQDQADNVPGNDGHYFVITGFDDSHFVVNDPDYWGAHVQAGHEAFISVSEIEKALPPYGSACIFLEDVSLTDQIIALAKQIEAIAAQIVVTPPTPPPDPNATVTANGLRVRTGPSITAAQLVVNGVYVALNTGARVTVEASGTAGWSKLVAPYAGNYVSSQYLNFD